MEVPVMRTRLAALAALCVIPIAGCSGSSPDPLVVTNVVYGVTVAACVTMGGTVVTVDLPMDGLVNCEGVK
jgi:hypothetical protein